MYSNNKYNEICDILKCYNSTDIASLKEVYKVIINSKRTFDRILTLSDLIKVLQKRDVVNEGDYTKLFDIARRLGINITLSTHNNLNHTHQPFEADESLPNGKAKDQAYNCICEEIGKKWKDFARELKYSEGRIDELDILCTTVSEKVRYVLKYNEENFDKRQAKSRLLDALRCARRQDLANKVAYIFDTVK